MSNEWFFPAGKLTHGDWESVVDSSLPGWEHTGLRIGVLDAGDRLALAGGDVERVVVPLAGSFQVTVIDPEGGTTATTLEGRHGVFDGPTDVLYFGVGASATIGLAATSGTGRVAVAEAPATDSRPSQYIPTRSVPVELRGAGRSTRQVHNFGTPGVLHAEKLIVCEVITPADNWSSYPTHKHDEHVPGHESALEEIYYFECAVSRGADAPAGARPFGLFGTYSSPAGEIDTNAMVHSGDIALVPFGYHGPAAAAPGYDLYYLNVMAGAGERAWRITDDPAHAWVRSGWDGQEIDPRLPYGAHNDTA